MQGAQLLTMNDDEEEPDEIELDSNPGNKDSARTTSTMNRNSSDLESQDNRSSDNEAATAASSQAQAPGGGEEAK